MMKRVCFCFRLVALLVLLGGFALVPFLTRVYAQTDTAAQSLEISPPSQELNADPGKTITAKAKITNKTANALPIRVRIEDFAAKGDEGQVALTEKGPWAVSTWTTLSPTEFTLKAQETKEVEAAITIPATGAAGGRYGSFVFSVTGESSKPGTAGISQEVASLFLIRISGPVDERIAISTFSAPSFMEFGPVPFTLMYKNDGDVHLRPQGLISITDMFGGKSADVVVDATNVFPQASRTIKPAWDKKLLVGKYTATAIVYMGNSANETMTATTEFIVFPTRIAAALAGILFIVYRLRRRLVRALAAFNGK